MLPQLRVTSHLNPLLTVISRLSLQVTSLPNLLTMVTSLARTQLTATNLPDPEHQIHIHSTLQLAPVGLPWDTTWMTTLRAVLLRRKRRRRMTANGMRIQTPLQKEMRTMETLLPGRLQKTTSTTTRVVQSPTARRTTAWRTGRQPGLDPGNTNHMQAGVGQEKRRMLGEVAKLVKYSVVVLRSA